MPKRVNDIMALLKRVGGQSTSLDMLMEFEKTLDAANLYAYKNWMSGELVEGPSINRYWFTTMWMYPYKLMPDPQGALRLLKYGCKVSYAQDTLLEPKSVKNTQTDLKGGAANERKQAKILRKPVWLVQIEMPRKFVDDAHDALLQFEDGEIDMDDINAAYDEDLGGEEESKEQDISAENDAREADFVEPEGEV